MTGNRDCAPFQSSQAATYSISEGGLPRVFPRVPRRRKASPSGGRRKPPAVDLPRGPGRQQPELQRLGKVIARAGWQKQRVVQVLYIPVEYYLHVVFSTRCSVV